MKLWTFTRRASTPFGRELAEGLFFLMSVLSQTLFAFVGGHFVFLSFFTAWHSTFRLVRLLADVKKFILNR
jgi:hypothetical protein